MPTDPTRPEPLTREQIAGTIFGMILHGDSAHRHWLQQKSGDVADVILALVAPLVERADRAEEECGRLAAENDLCKRIIGRLPLCMDHRDKANVNCVTCEAERLRAQVAALTVDRDAWKKRADEGWQNAEQIQASLAETQAEFSALKGDANAARAILAPNFANRGEHETQPLASIAECAVTSHKAWFDSSEKASWDAKRAWREAADLRTALAAAQSEVTRKNAVLVQAERRLREEEAHTAEVRARLSLNLHVEREALAAAQGENERMRKAIFSAHVHEHGFPQFSECPMNACATARALASPVSDGAFGTKSLDNQTQPEVE